MTVKNGFGSLVLLAVSTAFSPVASAQSAPAPMTYTRLQQAIDGVAAAALANKATAGFAVGVAQDGKVVLARGYGFANLEHRTPVTERTVFRIGSISKEFTAACVLLLADQGKLSLDNSLSKYFASFPRGGEVTIRQLLTHTSGIHNYTSIKNFLPVSSRLDLTTDEMVGVITGGEPLYDFAPGTAYAYSNSGYLLLGGIVEKVSGQPYAEFLKANILDPLSLSDTRIDDVAEIVPERAAGYDKVTNSTAGFANTPFISMNAAAAAGAMRSTVSDLLKWHQALLGGRLLKPASLKMMTSPGRLKDGRPSSASRPPSAQPGAPSEYGFGIMLGQRDGRRTIGHGGSINGFNASLYTYPDHKLTVVLLTNTGGGSAAVGPPLVEAIFATLVAK